MATGGVRAGAAFIELYVKNGLDKGLRQARAKLQTFSNSVQNMGRNLTGVAAVGAAPLAMAAATYANFADKMAEVRAVTGATERQFGQLEGKARELGATTSYSASQVAEAMKYLGMAGFNPDQIMAGIPAVLNLARAGATDLATAADIASDVGSAFGLTADDLGHVADVMAVTASSANTSIEMMGETLKYAAPLAKAAGQSIEDTAATIGILGNNGIKASMAGTDLALIMKSVGSSSKKALNEIGVATEAEGKIRGIIDVMKDVGAATADMTQSERLAFFEKNFGRAAKSALILSESGDAMDDLRTKIGTADGAAAKMAETMDDNLGGAFRRFMSAFEGVQISIGKALEGPLRGIVDWGGQALASIGKFIESNPLLVTSFAAIIAIAGAAGVGLLGMAFVMNIVAGAITGVITMLGALATVVAFLASPLGLAIVLIGALVAVIGGWIAAIGYATGFWSWAAAKIGEAFRYLWDTLGPIFQGLQSAMMSGKWKLAAQILWAGIKIAFAESMAFLLRSVESWASSVSSIIGQLVDSYAFSFELDSKFAQLELKQLLKEAEDLEKKKQQEEASGDDSTLPTQTSPEFDLPSVPDLEDIGGQVAKAWELAVGSSNSFAIDRIGTQAAPIERVETQLQEVNTKLATLVEQGEEAGDEFGE
ncbi:phage tail tape measure protein [Bremerella sp. JC770]|uniref:phage tail tape measure protein n=1 Tax=Bremerella sp. JC770 TaxID=3232137 RepID=UPI003459171D